MNRTMKSAGHALTLSAVVLLAACAEPASTPAGDPAAAPAPAAPAPVAEGAATAPVDGVAAADDAAPTAEAATTDADVDQSIDALLGNHAAYRAVFDRLHAVTATGDKAGFADLVLYPLDVSIGGSRRRIANAAEFLASWDAIVTPEVTQVITQQRYSDLAVNAQGVMYGAGQVWLNGVCRDNACTQVDVGVTAVQQGPQ